VLIGINLLREGLDLPEVSLVAILDAEKKFPPFLTFAHTNGRKSSKETSRKKVIMYADKITASMKKTIDETDRRREKH